MPPVIKFLLISNVVIFLFETQYFETLVGHFALWPYLPEYLRIATDGEVYRFHLWQLFSYAFLHGSWMHLLLNMYALWLFGVALENRWGSRHFAMYYLVCIIGAGLTQLLVTSLSVGQGGYFPTLGASGGVFGVLLAYGMIFPNQVLILLIPPMPIKAKYFVLIYGFVELIFGITGTQSGVAHFAHLGGMLFGFLLLQHWKTRPPR
jgi:membrane associated rhomboid family serine protease